MKLYFIRGFNRAQTRNSVLINAAVDIVKMWGCWRVTSVDWTISTISTVPTSRRLEWRCTAKREKRRC